MKIGKSYHEGKNNAVGLIGVRKELLMPAGAGYQPMSFR
jgi:hypothetical protein